MEQPKSVLRDKCILHQACALARISVVVRSAPLWNAQDESLPARHGRLAALALIEQAAPPCPPRPASRAVAAFPKAEMI